MTPAAPPAAPLAKDPPLLDWDELERRIARRSRRRVTLPGFRESAVLVLIVDVQVPSAGLPVDAAPPEPELLFIVRTATLPTHAGQIAFPGGKRELTDATLIATALRETAEEVGIPADTIRVLGMLDDMPTPVGFVITPVVGVLRGPLALRVYEGEVAATFTAALRRLPATYHNAGETEWKGYRYTMHEFLYGEYRIWGATAAITLQLLDTLSLLAAPPRDPDAIR